MKNLHLSISTQEIARVLLLVFTASGIAMFFTACYGPAYRHEARVENRIDRRDDRRTNRWDRRYDRWQ